MTDPHSGSRVAATAALAISSGVLYGYNLGVISGAILGIERGFELTEALKEATISSALLGAMIGALAGGHLADRFGRKPMIMAAGMLGGAAALLAASAQTAWMVIGCRTAAGVSFGVLACVTPILVAELSPADRRGRLLASFSVSLMVGLLAAYTADLALDRLEGGWRWMLGVGALPAILLLALAMRVPESPRWLAIRDDRKVAWKRVNLEELAGEGRRKASQSTALLAPAFRLGLLAALGLAFIRQGTGVAISTFYAPEILELTGFSSRTVDLAGSVGVGVLYVAMTLVALSIVDRIGRRPLMLGGLAGMCVGFIVLGLSLEAPNPTPFGAMAGVLGLFIFAAAFAIGPGAVVFVLMSEVLPQPVRAVGMGIASFVLWLSAFLSAYTFPFLENTIGEPNVFFLYSGLCLASIMFVHFVIPETKGRQLEEIGPSSSG